MLRARARKYPFYRSGTRGRLGALCGRYSGASPGAVFIYPALTLNLCFGFFLGFASEIYGPGSE